MRILLAEDDPSQAESIQTWLQMDGDVVDWVQRGDHALLAIEQHQYDCILLDRGLPKVCGDKILQSLRAQQKDVPVIMITAKDSIQDRVEGLDFGANDYLVKPFSLEELSARIRAQVRGQQHRASDVLQWNGLCLDLKAKTVLLQGQLIHLTAKEFQILHRLLIKPEHLVTREQLEQALYAWGDEIESNAIEVFIYQIRKKIGSKMIKTVRGLGYRMHQAEWAE